MEQRIVDVENVSIPSKSLEMTFNTISGSGTLSFIFILVIPAAVALVGFIVWMKRRKL